MAQVEVNEEANSEAGRHHEHHPDLTNINKRLQALSDSVNSAAATLPTVTPGACPNNIYTNSSPAPIMVPVQTRIVSGRADSPTSYGIQVGNTLYRAPNTGSAYGFQALELDRVTLNCVANVSYDALLPGQARQFEAQFSAGDCGLFGCLLIVQSLQSVVPFTCSTPNCITWGNAMAAYGGTTRLDTTPYSPGLGYSLVTNLTTGASSPGTERLTCYGSCPSSVIAAAENGVIDGVVVPDNIGAYTFAYPGRVSYDTGTGASSKSNKITIGANLRPGTYSGSYASGNVDSGFQVVALTKDSLQLQSNNSFDLEHLSTAQSGSNSMESVLRSAASFANSIVIISSIGSMEHSSVTPAWDSVGNQIASLGGTYSVFRNLSGEDTYSLFGGSGYSYGLGASELSSKILQATMLKAMPVARQTGTLARDRFGNLQPRSISHPSISANSEPTLIAPFDAIALSSPSPWPYSSTPDEIRAYEKLSYYACGNCTGPGAQSIRSQYTDSLLASATWRANLSTHQTAPAGYNAAAWANVWTELNQEFTELKQVKKSKSTFLEFYGDSQFGVTITLANSLNQVKASIAPAKTAPISPVWTKIISDSETIGGDLIEIALPGGGKLAWDILTDSVGLSLTIGENTHGTANKYTSLNAALNTTYENLQADSGDLFSSASDTLNSTFTLIYSDPVRLQTVYDLLNDDDITWGPTQQTAARFGMGYSMERSFMTDFIADVYTLGEWTGQANLQSVCTNYTSQQDCYGEGTRYGYCGSVFCNTAKSSPSVTESVAASYSKSLPASVYNTFLVVPSDSNIACDGNNNSQPFANLFAAVNPFVDPTTSSANLGLYKPYYFLYNHGDISVQVNQTCSNNHP